MLLLGIVAAAAVVGGLWYVGSKEDEMYYNGTNLKDFIEEYKMETTEENKYCIRASDGKLSVWRNAWALPSASQSFRIEFTVEEQCPANSGGILVGLCKKWKDESAGGIGLVIDDACPTGSPNIDTSTYFADLPHWNKPTHKSAIVHNHIVRGKQRYWIEWNMNGERKLSFGTPSSIFLYLPVDVDADPRPFCYLSFGCVSGSSKDFTTITNVKINAF